MASPFLSHLFLPRIDERSLLGVTMMMGRAEP